MRLLFSLALALALFPVTAFSQTANPPAATASPASGFRAEYLADLAGLERKIVSLAESMPQEKMTWRPAEGVRSVSEVFLHIAATNYTFPGMIGVATPAGLDIRGMQASTTDHAAIVEALKASFAHARSGVEALTDAAMDTAMQRSGPGWTFRRALVFQLRHASEHMGQLISYARVNGITPPWTEDAQRRQQQQQQQPPKKQP